MKFFRKKIIGAPENPLLVRYSLFRCEAFGIFLHHMLRSDHERALHDHPWPFVSVVLRGGYTEIHDQTLQRKETRVWHGPGSVLVRPAEWRHRFELSPRSVQVRCASEESLTDAFLRAARQKCDAWTLVFVGRRCRRWGFFVPKSSDALGNRRFRWCWWRKYDADRGICEERILHAEGED